MGVHLAFRGSPGHTHTPRRPQLIPVVRMDLLCLDPEGGAYMEVLGEVGGGGRKPGPVGDGETLPEVRVEHCSLPGLPRSSVLVPVPLASQHKPR